MFAQLMAWRFGRVVLWMCSEIFVLGYSCDQGGCESTFLCSRLRSDQQEGQCLNRQPATGIKDAAKTPDETIWVLASVPNLVSIRPSILCKARTTMCAPMSLVTLLLCVGLVWSESPDAELAEVPVRSSTYGKAQSSLACTSKEDCLKRWVALPSPPKPPPCVSPQASAPRRWT